MVHSKNAGLQIQLPVAAHLLKFMEKRFGDPVILDNSHHVLIALKMFLTPGPGTISLFSDPPQMGRQLPNTLNFMLVHNFYKSRVKISRKGIYLIHEYLDKFFVSEMQHYINKNWPKDKQHTRKSLIEKFCSDHNIIMDEDITLDCILKFDFRYRKNTISPI